MLLLPSTGIIITIFEYLRLRVFDLAYFSIKSQPDASYLIDQHGRLSRHSQFFDRRGVRPAFDGSRGAITPRGASL